MLLIVVSGPEMDGRIDRRTGQVDEDLDSNPIGTRITPINPRRTGRAADCGGRRVRSVVVRTLSAVGPDWVTVPFQL